MVGDLTAKHVMTSIKTCSSEAQILGIETAYDVWPEADTTTTEEPAEVVDQKVKMTHGVLDDTSLTCVTTDIAEGVSVSGILIFYNTATGITRMKVALTDKSVATLGPSNGNKSTSLINYNTTFPRFFGFATQNGTVNNVETLIGLGLVGSDDASCL